MSGPVSVAPESTRKVEPAPETQKAEKADIPPDQAYKHLIDLVKTDPKIKEAIKNSSPEAAKLLELIEKDQEFKGQFDEAFNKGRYGAVPPLVPSVEVRGAFAERQNLWDSIKPGSSIVSDLNPGVSGAKIQATMAGQSEAGIAGADSSD